MGKCPSFRTAEDYRDHLPCEECEPIKHEEVVLADTANRPPAFTTWPTITADQLRERGWVYNEGPPYLLGWGNIEIGLYGLSKTQAERIEGYVDAVVAGLGKVRTVDK